MDNEIQLSKYFQENPAYWKKFINEIMKEYADWKTTKTGYDVVSSRLEEYHAIIAPGKVVFETPAHKTWFILKWSIEENEKTI